MPGTPPQDLMIDLTGLDVGPADHARIHPDLARQVSRLRYVPFEVQPDQGAGYVAAIDPGPIPPTFCHSWAIDLEGITDFRLRADAATTHLNFDDGDDLTIYVPASGQRIRITSEQDLRSRWVRLQAVKGSSPPRAPRRIYVILRASPARYAEGPGSDPRRLRLLGLATTESAASQRAVLVGDDLNHTPTTPTTQQHWLVDGNGHPLPQPWRPAGGVSSTQPIEEPRPEKGWYLLGRFTAYQAGDDTPIWAVVHYNEQTARLRVHLWSEVETATGLEVRLRLLGQDPKRAAGYVALDGAFFDDDPRAQRWSEAVMVVTGLVERQWRYVETGVLFPMARTMPGAKDASAHGVARGGAAGARPAGAATSGPLPTTPNDKPGTHRNRGSVPPVSEWFVPVYDSIAEAQLRNVRLRMTITAFTRGKAALDFVGKGIGTAAQDMADGGDPMLPALKDAFTEGISAGKAGAALHDGIKGKFEDVHGKGAALVGPMLLGASGFGAIGAVVGAGIAVYKALTAGGMTMELELRIRGSVTGSIQTPLASTVFECYLPGRFDAEEMHGRDGIALDHAVLDQWIPRYDRTIGHVGFRYDPTETTCRAVYLGPSGDADPDTNITYGEYLWEWCTRCLWPAPRFADLRFPYTIFDASSRPAWTWDAAKHPAPQDAFLPLVTNEFAELVFIDTHQAKRVQIGGAEPDDPHQPTHRFVGPVSFAGFIAPEDDDTTFPKDAGEQGSVGGWSLWCTHGSDWTAYDEQVEDVIEIHDAGKERMPLGVAYWLDAGPGVRPLPLRDFQPYTGVQSHGFGQLSVVQYDEGHTNPGPAVDTVEFLGKDLDAAHHRPFKEGSPFPLADLLYRWELVYFHYGRSRQQPSGAVPRRRNRRMFRSPVTLDVMRWNCDWRRQEFAWFQPGGYGRSVMLTDAPWP